MTEDLLKEATRALREEGEETRGSDLTRARVMLSLHAAKRKRRARLAFGVPLVAVFVAGAAAAQISGALPHAVERVVEVFSKPATEAPAPAEPRPQAQGAPLVSANPEEPDHVPPMDEVDPEAEPSELEQRADVLDEAREPRPVSSSPEQLPSRPVAAASAPHAPKAQPEPRAPKAEVAAAEPAKPDGASAAAPTDPSHRRYLEAHQAHFVAHDYARALALWERYLQEFPRGRFAAEAQYNRALCLVRLGRTSEAKQALEPFANGRYGGYRQTEAQALIQAMGG